MCFRPHDLIVEYTQHLWIPKLVIISEVMRMSLDLEKDCLSNRANKRFPQVTELITGKQWRDIHLGCYCYVNFLQTKKLARV